MAFAGNCLTLSRTILSYAKQGLLTYAPDYLNNDPVPVEEMESGKFDVSCFLRAIRGLLPQSL